MRAYRYASTNNGIIVAISNSTNWESVFLNILERQLLNMKLLCLVYVILSVGKYFYSNTLLCTIWALQFSEKYSWLLVCTSMNFNIPGSSIAKDSMIQCYKCNSDANSWCLNKDDLEAAGENAYVNCSTSCFAQYISKCDRN